MSRRRADAEINQLRQELEICEEDDQNQFNQSLLDKKQNGDQSAPG